MEPTADSGVPEQANQLEQGFDTGTEGTELSIAPPEPSILSFLNPQALPSVVVVVVLAFVLARLVQRGLSGLAERFAGRRLLIKQWGTFLIFGLYGVALLIASALLFDFSSQAVLALSGGAAVTLGFALKDVAAGFLSSISILLTKPFQVGDRVSFQGHYGEISDIGLRSVRMVTLDDNLVTIPSNAFITDAVASANAGELDCMVVIPFYLDADCDHERAKEIVRDAVLSSRYLYLGKPYKVLTSIGLSEQGESYIQLNAKAYVFDARYEKDFLGDVSEVGVTHLKAEGIKLARLRGATT